MTWLILREPGKVPERKGPFRPEAMKATLREFMEARPSAFITVVDVSDGEIIVEDGPQCLEILDMRCSPTAKKHRASSSLAHASAALKIIEQQCWSMKCEDVPTGGGDADVEWQIVSHHQAKPHERIEGQGPTPMIALQRALTR